MPWKCSGCKRNNRDDQENCFNCGRMPADPTVNYSDPAGARRDMRAAYWGIIGTIALFLLKMLLMMIERMTR
jgi:hypothetical protein